MFYGGADENIDVFADEGDGKGNGKVNHVTVVEVLKDEAAILGSDLEGKGDKDKWFAYREQKWTAVDIAPDGMGLVGTFAERGGIKGMGMSRGMEGGLSGGVGNMAKVWGFGGRRV